MRRDPVRHKLIAAIILCLCPSVAAAQAEVLSELDWRSWAPSFGGLSGVEITDEGAGLVAVSDRGHLIRAEIARDDEGRITELSRPRIGRLQGPGGAWPRNRSARDSEGLALLPDGRLIVAYEGDHRIEIHAADGAFASALDRPVQVYALTDNVGIEGIAVDATGAIYAVPERWGWRRDTFPLLRHDDRGWSVAAEIDAQGIFMSVGLDVGPDGRLYLLERVLHDRRGFASRLRRFELDEAGIAAQEELWLSPHGARGNLEGISVWRDGRGRLIAMLVADDNYNPFLASEVLELILPD